MVPHRRKAAAILASPSNAAQLSELTSRCREKRVPMLILGAGANLLVRDEGVDAVVVRLDDPNFKQIAIDEKAGVVTAGAGVDLFKLVPASARAGLEGLVHVAGIPATIGGAVRMNAGGAFGDIGESVKRVQVMSDAGQVYYRDQDDLEFGYRHTNISAPFILEVEFALTPDDPAALMKRYKEIYFHKKNSQPMGDKSAGCCFKNPPAEVGRDGGATHRPQRAQRFFRRRRDRVRNPRQLHRRRAEQDHIHRRAEGDPARRASGQPEVRRETRTRVDHLARLKNQPRSSNGMTTHRIRYAKIPGNAAEKKDTNT